MRTPGEAERDSPTRFPHTAERGATEKVAWTAGVLLSIRPNGAGKSNRMITLFHHPFCPRSRSVRLALGEFGVTPRLVEERVWEQHEEFLTLNPEGKTPVLIVEGHPPVPGASIIAEYLNETRGTEAGNQQLLPPMPFARVEVQRLTDSFHQKFCAEVTDIPRHRSTDLQTKRCTPEQGRGPPDTSAIRAARHDVRYHLASMGCVSRASARGSRANG